MDSSGTGKADTIASSLVDSVPVQDSTIFSYISDLSPIKPFRGAPVAQGFAELSSPPLVFTSPQINPQHQSSSLKRPQYEKSNVEIPQQNDAKDAAAAAATSIDIFVKATTEFSNQLNHSADSGDGNNSSAHGKVGSPFRSADEYFADLLEVDCNDTGHAAKSLVQQSDKATSSSTLSEFHQDNIMNDVTIAVEPSSILEQCKEDCQVISSSYPVEGGEKENSDILNCFSVDHPSDDHNKHAKTENAGAVHSVEFNAISQQLEEPTQLAQVHKDGGESAGVVSVEQNIVLHDSKASRQHCGMTRRSLQFDGRQQNTVAKSCGSANQSNAANDLRSLATASEVINSSCVGICATPGSVELVNINKPILSMFSGQKAGKSRTAITKPSGIGLHLNSIVNCGVNASVNSSEDGYLNVPSKRSLTEDAANSLTSSKAVESLSVRSEQIQQNSHASIIATSVKLCNQSPEPVHEPVLLKKSTEHHSVPCDKWKYKSSPTKKRKRSSASDEGNGCKSCNCRKTKCLKLYCDCFAAGIYCAETCSCQGCFNSPEYEDTVLETRQHIESRNPLAFAPKIVQRVAKPPANNVKDINKSTPSSARHKRGCNCKKSMCLKKYCECYQSNVGCSDGCRCDGCKNVYGKREEYGSIKHIAIKEASNGKSEISIDQKLDTLLRSELSTPHNLTPSTPSFQYSEQVYHHGQDALYSRFSSGRYLQSPESDVAFFPTTEKLPDSPKRSDTHKIIQETGQEISDIISSEQQLYSCNSERVDDFSPNQRGTNSLSMYHNPCSLAMTSLVSSMTKVWTNDASSQVCPGSGSFSSLNSFQLCSPPVTPTVTFRENKLSKVLDCGNKCYNIIEDDDTPEILKENPIPVGEVKVNSPNKKRVSPPHSRFHDIGSSSSITELRSGRKFILKAVPSFPPLTPCIDAKSITSRSTNDLDSDNIK